MCYVELTLPLLNITQTWNVSTGWPSPFRDANMKYIASYQGQANTPWHNGQHGVQEAATGKQTKDQAGWKSSRQAPVLQSVSFIELMVEGP
jgi:hypothetical protein